LSYKDFKRLESSIHYNKYTAALQSYHSPSV
jgi:hypothetical protein